MKEYDFMMDKNGCVTKIPDLHSLPTRSTVLEYIPVGVGRLHGELKSLSGGDAAIAYRSKLGCVISAHPYPTDIRSHIHPAATRSFTRRTRLQRKIGDL